MTLALAFSFCLLETAEAQSPPADEENAEEETLVPPELVQDAQPAYPKRAREEGIGARVTVTVDIDEEGLVTAVSILEGAEADGYGFDEAALEAAKRLVFEPARVDDDPVPVQITYRFRFEPQVENELERPRDPSPQEEPPQPALSRGEIQGRLIERGTRLPLAGVRVTVFRGEGDDAVGFETETDDKGDFLFEGLEEGEWHLLAEPEGYYPIRQIERVAKDQRTSLKYRVERQSYNPYDVTVETDPVRREVSRTSIDAKRADRIPGTFGDVLAVIRNFPGVARTAGGGLVVRGSAPEDSKILVDKIEVPLLYHFGNLRSVMPLGMVESIDFYPGNYSVEYGRATGGVVDVKLKDLSPKKFGGYGDFNLFDTSVYLETPIGEDWAFAVAGRRSYIDALLSALVPNNGGEGDQLVAPRYWDAHALASYRPSPAHHVETFFMMSGDKFELVFEEPQVSGDTTVVSDIGYGVDFYRGIAEYHYVPSERFQNDFYASFGRDEVGFNVGDAIRIEAAIYQTQVRDTARYELSDAVAARAGVDYLVLNYDWQIRAPALQFEGEFAPAQDTGDDDIVGELGDEFNFSQAKGTNHSTGLFAELELEPYSGLLLVPGVRLDHFSRTEEVAVSPRGTARQELTEKWAVMAGVGLFVQEPQVQETDPDFGDPDLGLERAIHYSLGVEYNPFDYVNVQVTGFYKTLHDLVTASSEPDATGGTSVTNGGAGRVYGMEVSAKHELNNRFYGWLAYTLSRAERRDDGQTKYRLFDFDQTHILTLIGAYQLPKNWEVSSRFRVVSGSPYTPVTAAVYDVDEGNYRPVPGTPNSARLQTFRQLDFRIDKRWIYKNYILSAYLDIQNVTNQKHEDGVTYNHDYSETSSAQGLPILPVLGVRGEF